MIKIENWWFEDEYYNKCNPNTDKKIIFLCGNVYGHPRFEAGDAIKSSSVLLISEDIVQTYSGSVYVLGKPNKHYKENYLDKI